MTGLIVKLDRAHDSPLGCAEVWIEATAGPQLEAEQRSTIADRFETRSQEALETGSPRAEERIERGFAEHLGPGDDDSARAVAQGEFQAASSTKQELAATWRGRGR